MSIREHILELETQHGGLRATARVLRCDAAYLLRLREGEKTNPSDALLRKLGLKKVVTYVRAEIVNNEHVGERLEAVFCQDENGTRWVYSNDANSSISGPNSGDLILGKCALYVPWSLVKNVQAGEAAEEVRCDAN